MARAADTQYPPEPWSSLLRSKTAANSLRGWPPLRKETAGAHDFVGEWGNLPWDEAAKWVNPARLESIHGFYNRLRTADGYFGGEFDPVEVCDKEGKTWQVAYQGTPDSQPVYFLINRTAKWTFVVDDIRTAQQEGCTTIDDPPGAPFQTMFDKPLEE